MIENTLKCSKCEENKPICKFSKGKRAGKDYWCKSCHTEYKKSRKSEKCCVCGELKKVDKRVNSKPVCSVCNSKLNKDLCIMCGKNKVVSTRIGKGAICKNCNRPKRICSVCGKNNRIELSNSTCSSCYKKVNKEECHICHKLKNVNRRINGKSICSYCDCVKEFCSLCSKKKIVYTRIYEYPICSGCYNKIRYHNDENYRIRICLSSRIRGNIKSGVKYKEIIAFIGKCPGDNYHIDHIFPLKAFNLINEDDLLVAFCPENHQWLTAGENLKKGSKYNKQELIIFKNKMISKYKGANK